MRCKRQVEGEKVCKKSFLHILAPEFESTNPIEFGSNADAQPLTFLYLKVQSKIFITIFVKCVV
jgi:hypothetical protein